MRICDVKACNGKHEAKGYCKKHYKIFHKYGDPLATPVRKENKKRKPRVPYGDSHKIIDNIEYKRCGGDCKDWYPMNDEYFYKNKSNKIDGYHTWCKNCSIEKSRNRQLENHDDYKEYLKQWVIENKILHKEMKKDWSKRNKENLKESLRQWQINNPDKVAINNLKRRSHKEHYITDQEWFECLDFFDKSCAYCGISEIDNLIRDGQQLHKEHVDHEGANDITNCVPACRSCNSSKHTSLLNDWYNENNPIFSKRRYNKIIKWLMSFVVEDVN